MNLYFWILLIFLLLGAMYYCFSENISLMVELFWACLLCIFLCLILSAAGIEFVHEVYAIDEETSNFLSKLSKVKHNVDFWTDVVRTDNQDFRDIISDLNKTDPKDTNRIEKLNKDLVVTKQSMKDSSSNLESEKRMLKILQAKKDAGDFTLPTSSSVTSKRGFED